MVDEIAKQILEYRNQHIQHVKVSEESKTFVPYYDSIIEKSLRGDLCRIKMNPLTKSKVNNQALRATMMAKSIDLYHIDDKNHLIHHQ